MLNRLKLLKGGKQKSEQVEQTMPTYVIPNPRLPFEVPTTQKDLPRGEVVKAISEIRQQDFLLMVQGANFDNVSPSEGLRGVVSVFARKLGTRWNIIQESFGVAREARTVVDSAMRANEEIVQTYRAEHASLSNWFFGQYRNLSAYMARYSGAIAREVQTYRNRIAENTEKLNKLVIGVTGMRTAVREKVDYVLLWFFRVMVNAPALGFEIVLGSAQFAGLTNDNAGRMISAALGGIGTMAAIFYADSVKQISKHEKAGANFRTNFNISNQTPDEKGFVYTGTDPQNENKPVEFFRLSGDVYRNRSISGAIFYGLQVLVIGVRGYLTFFYYQHPDFIGFLASIVLAAAWWGTYLIESKLSPSYESDYLEEWERLENEIAKDKSLLEAADRDLGSGQKKVDFYQMINHLRLEFSRANDHLSTWFRNACRQTAEVKDWYLRLASQYDANSAELRSKGEIAATELCNRTVLTHRDHVTFVLPDDLPDSNDIQHEFHFTITNDSTLFDPDFTKKVKEFNPTSALPEVNTIESLVTRAQEEISKEMGDDHPTSDSETPILWRREVPNANVSQSS